MRVWTFEMAFSTSELSPESRATVLMKQLIGAWAVGVVEVDIGEQYLTMFRKEATHLECTGAEKQNLWLYLAARAYYEPWEVRWWRSLWSIVRLSSVSRPAKEGSCNS